MSDNITNNFNVSGTSNTVNFHQEIGSDGNKTLEIVFKFLLTLLLSPIMLPLLLAANAQRGLLDDNQEDD